MFTSMFIFDSIYVPVLCERLKNLKLKYYGFIFQFRILHFDLMFVSNLEFFSDLIFLSNLELKQFRFF